MTAAAPVAWPLHPIANSAERALYESQGEIAYMHEKCGKAWTSFDPIVHTLASTAGASPHMDRGNFPPSDAASASDFLRAPEFWPGYVLAWNLGHTDRCTAGLIVLLKRRNQYAFPVACSR